GGVADGVSGLVSGAPLHIFRRILHGTTNFSGVGHRATAKGVTTAVVTPFAVSVVPEGAPSTRLVGTNSPGSPRPSAEELPGRVRGGVHEEGAAALLLLGLLDLAGGLGERGQGPQEASVGLVRPRHRALPLPAGAAQPVQPPVVTGTGVGIALDGAARVERALGEDRPREGRRREVRRHRRRVLAGLDPRRGWVFGQLRLGDAQEVVHQAVTDVPAERRFSQASTTRA